MSKIIAKVELRGEPNEVAPEGIQINEGDGGTLDTHKFLVGVLNYWDAKRLDPKATRTFEQTVVGLDAMREVRLAQKESRSAKLTNEQYKLIEPTIKEYAMKAYGFHAVTVIEHYDKAVSEEK